MAFEPWLVRQLAGLTYHQLHDCEEIQPFAPLAVEGDGDEPSVPSYALPRLVALRTLAPLVERGRVTFDLR